MKHQALIILQWDEELAEKWMNEDNLKTLLYTETKTREDLLDLVVYHQLPDLVEE